VTPGAKLSTRTSARATISRRRSRPFSVLRLSVTGFLFEFSMPKGSAAPPMSPRLRRCSPWSASDQQIAAPHIAITIDRNAAYRLGLSLSSIDQTLYDAFGQRQIANIYTPSRTYKLILEVQPQFQDDPAALSRIYLAGPTGSRIPLSAIAHFSTKVEPLTVNHQGQFPAVTLSFDVAPGYSLGQAVERIRAIQEQLACPDHVAGHVPGHGAARSTQFMKHAYYDSGRS
jgi:multidrug efflux pump subunit AcrB